MKRKAIYILVVIIGLGAVIAALLFIPVASKATGCGPDQRFSIVQGQTAEYNSKMTRKQAINEGVCANYGSYKLFLL